MTITTRVLASLTLLAGFGSAMAAPPVPRADEMAAVQPKQPGVAVTPLAPADAARLRVVPYPDAANPVGYILADANNKPVRRFLAVGAKTYNILSFYRDGQEVYRETDVPTGKQYRWLGANGSKVGVDTDGNGSIDVWEAISPEEVSKEVFDALVRNDRAKLQSLLVTQKELQAIGLPAAQVQALVARSAKAVERFQTAVAELKLTEKSKWVHVELWTPETTPADEFQGRTDFVRHRNAGILVDTGADNRAVTFQLGEIVQVGRAWKLVDGPLPGAPAADAGPVGGSVEFPKEVQDALVKMQGVPVPAYGTPEYTKYQVERAAVLAAVVTKLQGHEQQSVFIKQLLDAYVAAAEGGDADSGKQLVAWQAQIDKVAKGSPLAGFAAFRVLGLEYTTKLVAASTKPKEIGDVQTWWRESLTAFIKSYPAIDETAEAHYRLALAEEQNGAKGETEAKANYAAIVKTFPTHQLAAQAAGSIRRLDSEGQALALAGTTLDGKPLNLAQLGGTATIVYFWGSFHGGLKADAKELAALEAKYAGKVKVVTVCLDADAKAATQAARDASLPGAHLFSPDGSLGTQYGIIGTHLMLVGKDGKVANKNAQLAFAAEEIEKLVK
ncbi:MAG: redoxin domain-containing protein [Gemmataceae bacterium]|nr:redoxin domain-containing protein [Planctomycetia bacterium]MBX3399030.1 redoxin domain-containing protein [Gemmataceae bacterium]